MRNAWLKECLDTVLPELTKREGFVMGIAAAREYNEAPLIEAWCDPHNADE